MTRLVFDVHVNGEREKVQRSSNNQLVGTGIRHTKLPLKTRVLEGTANLVFRNDQTPIPCQSHTRLDL